MAAKVQTATHVAQRVYIFYRIYDKKKFTRVNLSLLVLLVYILIKDSTNELAKIIRQ
jgi:hypothetical protein